MNAAKENAITAITHAQRELESALEQIDHLPAFDSGTVGFAAHALSNYEAVIRVSTELLREALGDCGNAEIMCWLDGLKHAGELMAHTTNQLMGMADGADAFKLSEVDFGLLVERGCSYYRRPADRKRIEIELGETNLPPVWADRVALAAALDNLLSNAVKYSPRGSTIHVSMTKEPAALVCRVRDEGPGISPNDRLKLFQRGARLTARPTAGEPSSGFGLAVAKELITKTGGEIWYEAPAAGGACFAIRLPLATR